MIIRVLALFVLIGLAVCKLPDPVNDFQKQFPDYSQPKNIWATFKQQFNRTYVNSGDEQARFVIFLENLLRAQQLNQRDPRANYGVTQFMDLSPAEFRARMLNSHPQRLLPNFPPTGPSTPRNISQPAAFDWRSRGVVTGVYNQGSCGSCWAFSVTENIESRWAIAGRGLNNLSVQQVIDCCDEASMGCRGGDPREAYDCIQSMGGQDLWQDYPYIDNDGSCHFQKAWVAAQIGGWQYATQSGNEGQMLDYLYGNGPLSACVDASNWQYYSGGVVGPNACGTSLDHCIQLTGYDTSNNPPYWWVRNSWGNWGPYGGYIALEYGTNTCGVASLVTSGVPS